jgi:membrane fusion protein (multidrug efflux system)
MRIYLGSALTVMAFVLPGSVGAQPLGLNPAVGRISDPRECLIAPRIDSSLGSPVEGVIKRFFVDRGQEVKAGDPLVELEATVERAALSLKSAQEAYGGRRALRNQALIEQKLLSEGEQDELLTQTEIAKLERAHQEALLSQKTIRAPFSGLVLERFLSPGDRVSQEKILRLVQLNPLSVEVMIPAQLMNQIKPGMSARVSNPEFFSPPVNGRVEIVDRVVDVASATVGVRILISNPDKKIPAGITCMVEFLPK